MPPRKRAARSGQRTTEAAGQTSQPETVTHSVSVRGSTAKCSGCEWAATFEDKATAERGAAVHEGRSTRSRE
jgi:hypothetical protein